MPHASTPDTDLVNAVVRAVTDAGRAVMDVYAGAIAVVEKDDCSPLTEADLRAHEILAERLPRVAPVPVVSEESADAVGDIDGEFWLVDPLDGTKEFVKRSGEFTLNVALIREGAPVLGVVHAPAIGVTWHAAIGLGAFESTADGTRQISPRVPAASPLRVAVSRDHLSRLDRELLLALEKVEAHPMGSSLKFCRVAAGDADLYVRFGRTMEWDTAAAHCVVACAGGRVVDLSGTPLAYGKRDRGNPSFLCFADRELERVIGIAAGLSS